MEIWKPIPGTDWYEASSLGRVRSLDRRVWNEQTHRKYWMKVRGKILSVRSDKDGYRTTSLTCENVNLLKRVGRLVCSAFHGPCPVGMQCCHGPEGKTVDTPENVYWGTKSRNERDKRRDGVSNCMPVKRSDGKMFDSIREAAKSVNGNEGYLSVKLRGGYPNKVAYGYEWAFVGEEFNGIPSTVHKKVLRSDGRIFNSVTAGAKESGVSQGNVSNAIKTGGCSGGYKWKFA